MTPPPDSDSSRTHIYLGNDDHTDYMWTADADTHARYDYVTLNHFADITEGSGRRGVTLSNSDCAFAKLGASTPQYLDTASPEIHVLAGGQVDGRSLGIEDQNGAREFTQRFALQPHQGFDPISAMRFSLEHQNPFVTGEVKGDASSPYPEDGHSLLSLDDPAVVLWALKPAEEGIQAGLIARLWNLSNQARDVKLTVNHRLLEVKRTTHLETDLDPLLLEGGLPIGDAVKIGLLPHQIQTLRLVPSLDSQLT